MVPFGGRNNGGAAGMNGGGVGTSDWYCGSPSTEMAGFHFGGNVGETQVGLRLVELQLAEARIGFDRRLLECAEPEPPTVCRAAVRAAAPARTARTRSR